MRIIPKSNKIFQNFPKIYENIHCSKYLWKLVYRNLTLLIAYHSALEWIWIKGPVPSKRLLQHQRVPHRGTKKHVLKSSTSGRNNKIFQSSFGLVMQPIFLAIKKGCSVNKKWLFWEKITSCFLAKSKSCHWAI